MPGIRLEFAQFGDFDSFDVIRSTSSMSGIADVDLPSPIVTGLTTMYYVDTAVVIGATYYYKVRVNRDGVSIVSDETSLTVQLGDQYWDYVSSLLHFNGANNSTTFTDQKDNTWTRNGSPVISTENSKFGGASGKLSSGNYISTNNMSGFLFGASENFTIEAWLYIPTSGSIFNQFVPIISVGVQNVSSDGGGWNFGIFNKANATIRLEIDATNGTAQAAEFQIDSALPRDTWMHIEFGRSGGITYGFFNGNLIGTSTVHNNLAFSSPNVNKVSIGSGDATTSNTNLWYLDGFIDELRVTKGVCRHTASFAPQTSEYPNWG